MPWSVKKRDDMFCVIKEGESSPIKGGCHDSRAEAVDHLQALYASEAMSSIAEAFLDEDDDINELDFEVIGRTPILAAAFDITERTWSGPIAFEELSTGDNRKFGLDAITWDEPPMPLLFQRISGEGHKGSVVIGRVDAIERRDNTIFAHGVILEGIPEADEFLALLEHQAAGGVSVDGDSAVYTVEEAAVQGSQPSIKFTGMRIRGLTAVAIPAFSDAAIELDEETEELAKKRKRNRKKKRAMTWSFAQANDALLAAAAPIKPPLEWFSNPELDGPTPMTITPDGYVFGHLALFNTCHIGMPACTRPPKNCTYAYFHTGEVDTEEGTPVAVGHLTFNTGHAGMNDAASVAAAHYDNTGYVGADVVVGEDRWGVWFAGALRPELSEEQVRTFRAAPLSGDWRRIGGRMELVAALSVNTPGFPVPRSRALVASGFEPETVITVNEETYVMDTKTRMIQKAALAVRVRSVFAEAQCKTEGGVCYPAGDYAYVPDANAPSTWKLRLTEAPGAEPTAAQVGRAVAALGKGFRGNKVEIPADDLAAVKAKVKAAWKATHEDGAEVPAILASAAETKVSDLAARIALLLNTPEEFCPGMDHAGPGQMMMDGDENHVLEAKKRVVEAIQLHEGHLAGSVPTDSASQNELMELLMEAKHHLKLALGMEEDAPVPVEDENGY